MNGRPPDPTRLKILRGTLRADRMNEDEPQPLEGIPDCPEFLCPVAKEKWAEMVRVLEWTGILTQADVETMAQYCQAYARWRDAEIKLDKLGNAALLSDNTRQAYKSLHAVMRHESARLTHLSTLLGLDPSSRTRLHVNAGVKKSKGVGARDRTKGPPPPARLD